MFKLSLKEELGKPSQYLTGKSQALVWRRGRNNYVEIPLLRGWRGGAVWAHRTVVTCVWGVNVCFLGSVCLKLQPLQVNLGMYECSCTLLCACVHICAQLWHEKEGQGPRDKHVHILAWLPWRQALLELPLKWRAVNHCMPPHSHNEFTWRQSRHKTPCKKQEHAHRRLHCGRNIVTNIDVFGLLNVQPCNLFTIQYHNKIFASL